MQQKIKSLNDAICIMHLIYNMTKQEGPIELMRKWLMKRHLVKGDNLIKRQVFFEHPIGPSCFVRALHFFDFHKPLSFIREHSHKTSDF